MLNWMKLTTDFSLGSNHGDFLRETGNESFFESPRFRGISAALLSSMMLLSACGRSPDIVYNPTGAAHIVGGESLAAKSAPKKEPLAHSVVALVAASPGRESLCTGTILTDDVVLTAAHCVEDNPEKMIVVFSPSIKKAAGPAGLNPNAARVVDRYVQNPNWGKDLKDGRGDLALVHFSGGLPEGYTAVTLAGAEIDLKAGVAVRMIGYGVSNGLRNTGSGTLRETETTVVQAASPTEIVTDGRKSSVCFGDSGGPAFSEQNGAWVQWGVASSVTNQACNQASIHTEVMNYVPWIKTTILRLRQGKLN